MSGRAEKGPTFLDPGSYRQRRFRDLVRVLPFVGAVLVAIPLLWPRSGAEAALTSSALIYLFAVWVMLILLARALASRVGDGLDGARDADGVDLDGPGPGAGQSGG